MFEIRNKIYQEHLKILDSGYIEELHTMNKFTKRNEIEELLIENPHACP